MNLDSYQNLAIEHSVYPTEPLTITFVTLSLAGEAGEVANVHKKELRDGSSRQEHALEELGDVLFYLSLLAHKRGVTLEQVALGNLEKLRRLKLERETA